MNKYDRKRAIYNNILRVKEKIKNDFDGAMPPFRMRDKLKRLRAEYRNFKSWVPSVEGPKYSDTVAHFHQQIILKVPQVKKIQFPRIFLESGNFVLMNKEWFYLFRKEKHVLRQETKRSFRVKLHALHIILKAHLIEEADWYNVFQCETEEWKKPSFLKPPKALPPQIHWVAVSSCGKFCTFSNYSTGRAVNALEKRMLNFGRAT